MTSPGLAHELGVHAWNWLDAHLDCFGPRSQDEQRDPVAWLKPTTELALAAAVLLREGVGGTRQATAARRALEFTWHELLAGGDVLQRLQKRIPLSTVPMELYVVFRDHGYLHHGLDDTLRSLRVLRGRTALELVPTRALNVADARERLGLDDNGGRERLLRRTWLGRLPEPWLLDTTVAYELTHTVFHLTTWGAHAERVPGDIADYLALWLPVWLEEHAHRRQWDLLAELLATDACLAAPALDPVPWAQLAAAQTPDGAIPFTGDMPAGDRYEVFDAVHHSTIVTAFAAALATSRALNTLAATS